MLAPDPLGGAEGALLGPVPAMPAEGGGGPVLLGHFEDLLL